MHLNKVIIAVFLATIIGSNVNSQQTEFDLDDISAYFGFGEIEIIKLEWGINDLTVADFNGDGRNDIAVVNNTKAKIELLIQKETVGPGEKDIAVDINDIDVNTITPVTRFDKQSIAVSEKMHSLVCGDLNSDGMTDFAYYGEPKGLYVILQKAGTTETSQTMSSIKRLSWRTKKRFEIDDGLLTSNILACADLNNDGDDDLALAGRDGVYIALQKEGSLIEPVKYPTSTITLSLKIGDLNGDNINDLILMTNDMEKPVHVRFGLKTGQLGPQVRFFIERPFAFELHNIDGAAGDEILTIESRSGRLICYKFSLENQKDADWPILFYPLASGEADTTRDMAIGDFDGDGLSDVVISDPGAAELIFYRQVPKIGLTEPVRFPAFSDITSLSAVDINGDGKTELGILSIKEKVVGLSSFEDDRLSFPQPVDITGQPVAMELADVDNDGNMDCLYISTDNNNIRSLRIIYNLAAQEQQLKNSMNVISRKSETVENTDEIVSALELKKLTSNPDGLKVLDVDQDGLQDALIFVSYELPILVHQVQKRKFGIIDSQKALSSLIKDASLRSTAMANVDGKSGEELLVAQKNFARSLVFSEDQSWSIIDQYNAKNTEDQISSVAAFNIYGECFETGPAILLLDGRKGQLQILKTSDDKTYRVEKELDVGKWNDVLHLKILFAQLTGNHAYSLVLFDSGKFALITPPSSSNFTQLMEQLSSYETKIKDGMYGNLVAGDINEDGQTDIIMVEYRNNHIEILTLDADLKPIPAMRFKIFEQKVYRDIKGLPKSRVEPRELKIVDVTNDDQEDLVTVIHDRIIIYPQD
jgi:hypothetical protein